MGEVGPGRGGQKLEEVRGGHLAEGVGVDKPARVEAAYDGDRGGKERRKDGQKGGEDGGREGEREHGPGQPFSFARGPARATLRTLSDLGVFEVRSEKPAMTLRPSGVSDLWSGRLPPILKKKIIFDGDRR